MASFNRIRRDIKNTLKANGVSAEVIAECLRQFEVGTHAGDEQPFKDAMPPVRHIHVTKETDANKIVVEASELGLAPGEWPDVLYVTFDCDAEVHEYEKFGRGPFEVIYSHTAFGDELVVLND